MEAPTRANNTYMDMVQVDVRNRRPERHRMTAPRAHRIPHRMGKHVGCCFWTRIHGGV